MSRRYADAFQFAHVAHAGQRRKGTTTPYISHPIAVSALVLEHGGTEAQAIAALLHDTIEDCGITRKAIERRFGRAVARIVSDCSDSHGTPKPPWKHRKLRYLAALKIHSADSLLVSAADKLHNARAIVRDVERHGQKVWNRFNARPPDILWYYRSLAQIFEQRLAKSSSLAAALVHELKEAVTRMEALVGKGRAAGL